MSRLLRTSRENEYELESKKGRVNNMKGKYINKMEGIHLYDLCHGFSPSLLPMISVLPLIHPQQDQEILTLAIQIL